MITAVSLIVGFAGFVDAVAGGGGIISLPAYFLTGMPAHVCYGTNKFSSASVVPQADENLLVP